MRLFDSKSAAASAQEKREAALKGAQEAERILKEEMALEFANDELSKKLSAAAGIQPIRYEKFRQPGSKWMIEHSRVGEDYIYQVFPLKPISTDWRDVVVLLIAAMDSIFPKSVQIQYSPPNERYQLRCFTVRVQKVADQPGWQDACQNRALRALAAVSI
jgi:hypothetical protein